MDEVCCVCGQMTNEGAGNPGVWPVTFGHIGGEGKTFTHCQDCCAKMYAAYIVWTSTNNGEVNE
jgi:hypothetical protein